MFFFRKVFIMTLSIASLAIAEAPVPIKIPNACASVFDDVAPTLKSVKVSETASSSLISYTSAVDVSTPELIGGSGLKSVWLWLKKSTDNVWRKTGTDLAVVNGTFQYNRTDPLTVRYSFAVQSEDMAGNRSPLIIPLALKPQIWFFVPDELGKMRVVIQLPAGKKLSDYLVLGFSLSTGETITKVGIGGPHGWGLSSTDLVAYRLLPIIDLYSGFDGNNRFRGTPFIVTSLGRVAYFNLGASNNPVWEMSFGDNPNLVFPDGSGGTIIDFYQNEYIQLPTPTIVFNWRWDLIGSRYDISAIVDVVGRDIRDLFYGLSEQSQIKSITIEHYYLTGLAPKIDREVGCTFKDYWPVEIIIDKSRLPTFRGTIVAIDSANQSHYADVSQWLVYVNGQPTLPRNGAWEFQVK